MVVFSRFWPSRRLHWQNAACVSTICHNRSLPGQYQSSTRIGESAWVGLPGEIFVEIGLAIKKKSPCNNTFAIGLANIE